MSWPGLVIHAMAIDVDLDVLQQLINIKVASVLRLATADNPCDGSQLFPEGFFSWMVYIGLVRIEWMKVPGSRPGMK